MEKTGSREVARAAISMSLSKDRAEEKQLAADYQTRQILAAAVDFGGEFIPNVQKIIERTLVAAKREKLIGSGHPEEGALVGAVREALMQVSQKALGMNVGGKIGIARYSEHIAVCLFFDIGMLDLNEVSIGLGHRVI